MLRLSESSRNFHQIPLRVLIGIFSTSSSESAQDYHKVFQDAHLNFLIIIIRIICGNSSECSQSSHQHSLMILVISAFSTDSHRNSSRILIRIFQVLSFESFLNTNQNYFSAGNEIRTLEQKIAPTIRQRYSMELIEDCIGNHTREFSQDLKNFSNHFPRNPWRSCKTNLFKYHYYMYQSKILTKIL